MPEHFDPYYVWLGIPPEEQPASFYRLLGVRPLEENADVISNALDQRRAHLRSLQTGKRAALSQHLLNEVSAAGVCLLDPAAKRAYDEQLKAKTKAAETAARGSPVLPVAQPLTPVVVAQKPLTPLVIKPSPEAKSRPAVAPAKLAMAGIGGLALLLLLGAAWWMWSGSRRPTSPPVPAPGAVNPKPAALLPSPLIPPLAANSSIPTPPSSSLDRTGSAAIPPPATSMAGTRDTWLGVGEPARVFRKVGAKWVEFREKFEYWYQTAAANPTAVSLHDASRNVSFELYADRAELQTPWQVKTVACRGRWIDASELPEFAKRAPAAAAPSLTLWHEPAWHALMLDPRARVRGPLPAEICNPTAEFTIEAWLRVDWTPNSARVLTTDKLALSTMAQTPGASQFSWGLHVPEIGPRFYNAPDNASVGNWHHVALVRSGGDLRLFVDGVLKTTVSLPVGFALQGDWLDVGSAPSAPVGMTGLIRDLRISSGARYAADFRPPLRFEKEAQTLSLPHFLSAAGNEIEDLARPGKAASRGKAQWAPLGDEGTLLTEPPVAGQIWLMRSFAVSRHTLRGSTYRASQWAETRNETGPAQVLMAYRPSGDYDVSLQFSRLKGEGGALLGVVVGNKQALVAMDVPSTAGPLTGILPGDFKRAQAAPGPLLTPVPQLLATGQKHHATVRVRQPDAASYDIEIVAEDRSVFRRRGPLSELGVPTELSLPLSTVMCFGSLDASIRYNILRLTPVNSALPAAAPAP